MTAKTSKTNPIKRDDYVSTTKATDEGSVPAFETSAGIPPRSSATKPVYVNEQALANFNAQVDPAVQKHQIEAANVAALFAKRAIRPDEIAALRRRYFEVAASSIDDVAEVMAGKKNWSNVQVRLFSIITERVLPKLSNITVDQPGEKSVEDMSIEELEAIVRGKKNHEAVDAVVKQGKQLEASAVHGEMVATGKAIKTGELAHITSLDKAEKKYRSKLASKEVTPSAPKKESTPVAENSSPTWQKASDAEGH